MILRSHILKSDGALPYFGPALPLNKPYLNKALAFSFGSLRSLEEGDRNVCSKINVNGVCISDAGSLRSYEYRKAERAGDPRNRLQKKISK